MRLLSWASWMAIGDWRRPCPGENEHPVQYIAGGLWRARCREGANEVLCSFGSDWGIELGEGRELKKKCGNSWLEYPEEINQTLRQGKVHKYSQRAQKWILWKLFTKHLPWAYKDAYFLQTLAWFRKQDLAYQFTGLVIMKFLRPFLFYDSKNSKHLVRGGLDCITKFHRLGGLHNRNLFPHRSRSWKSEIRMLVCSGSTENPLLRGPKTLVG